MAYISKLCVIKSFNPNLDNKTRSYNEKKNSKTKRLQ